MKIGIIGHFGIGEMLLNGQTIKSRNLADGLEKYTDAEVIRIDSRGWTRAPISLINRIRSAFKECDAIIMLPAHSGIRVLAPLLVHYGKKYKKKIFYDVIGGWLPEFLNDKKRLSAMLEGFDGIWVETSTMNQALCAKGFENVSVVPNFKELEPLAEAELAYASSAPYKLCTFSRVMKEKGIETAADAIKKINNELGYTALTLDIYGQIDPAQTEWFDELKRSLPEYIRYCGCADPEKSVELLRDYFALLFPTHFYTEGIPGTVIDAYAAGVPVISARWESFSDVIDDQKTGIGYKFGDTDELELILASVAKDPRIISDMKPACIKKAKDFMTETVISSIMSKL